MPKQFKLDRRTLLIFAAAVVAATVLTEIFVPHLYGLNIAAGILVLLYLASRSEKKS